MRAVKFIREKVHQKQMATASSLNDESLVVAMHLENRYGLAHSDAIDQTSQSGGDHGIDGWCHDSKSSTLLIFQSKLTEDQSQVRSGLRDLLRAADWLKGCLLESRVDKKPDNNALYNLLGASSSFANQLKQITFALLSPFEDIDEISASLGAVAVEEFKHALSKHEINRAYETVFEVQTYQLESNRIPRPPKRYPVRQFEESTLKYKSGSLRIAYLPLEQLVELYRSRGSELFHKNIRLTVWDAKKNSAKRVAHPMKETLSSIVNGAEEPEVFAFYHSGVTICADNAEFSAKEVLLENPSIINGCQTTTIAHSFLEDIRTKKNTRLPEQLARFAKINVIAKIIVGTGIDDLREITNNNNRQNPIEPWQLYSNDPIHIRIEALLKERHIFYGRQAGQFKEQMKMAESVAYFGEHSKREFSPKELGQVLSIYKGNFTFAAKPEKIFESKENHEVLFNENILREVDRFVFLANSNRAIRNAIREFINDIDGDGTRDSYETILTGHQRFYYAVVHVLMKIAESRMPEELSLRTRSILNQKTSTKVIEHYREIASPMLKFSKQWFLACHEGRQGELTKSLLDEFVKDSYQRYGVR